MTTFLNRRETA